MSDDDLKVCNAEFQAALNVVAERIRQVITAAGPARASLSQSRPMKHLAGLIGELVKSCGPAQAALERFQATVATLAATAEMKPNL